MNFKFLQSNVRWAGHSYHLTRGEDGKARSGLAVMCMLVERWLSEIE